MYRMRVPAMHVDWHSVLGFNIMKRRFCLSSLFAQEPSYCGIHPQGDPARREDWGIVPFVVAELLARVAAAAGSGRSYLVTLSVVELYGEQLRDLLAAPGKHALNTLSPFYKPLWSSGSLCGCFHRPDCDEAGRRCPSPHATEGSFRAGCKTSARICHRLR